MSNNEKIHQLEQQLAKLDSKPHENEHKEIDILNELAWLLSDIDLKRSYELSETAYALSKSAEDKGSPYPHGMALSLRTQGYLNERFGNYDLALTQLYKAQKLCELLQLDDVLTDVFDFIAGTYSLSGDYPMALKFVYKQLEAAQRIDDKRRIVNAYNNLTHHLFETGDYEQVLEIQQKNLQIAKEIGYKRVECIAYGNLAESYQKTGENEKALEYGWQGLHISKEEGYELFEIHILDILGNIYLKIGDTESAVQHLKNGLELSNKVGSQTTEYMILLKLGQAYLDRQQFDLALDTLQKGLSIAQAAGAQSELFQGHLALSKLYEQQGDLAQAFHHYKQYHAIKELTLGENADQRLKVLQVVHDTETAKKETEIERLRTVELEREVEERTSELNSTVRLLQKEVNERKRAEAEIQHMVDMLEQRVADRSRELAALYDMTILFTEAQNLTDMLEPALQNICQNVKASGITVHILSADKSHLQLAAQLDINDWQRLKQIPIPPNFTAWIDHVDMPLMVRDKSNTPPFLPEEILLPSFPTYFGAPLRVRNEVIGLLGVYREENRPFSVQKISLLVTMAEQLGIIIQNHRLQEETQHIARTIERQQLSRELHDSVAQRIYSLHLFASAGLEALHDDDPEDAIMRLEQVNTNALEALREMRLLLYQLRPLALENQTLPAAFEKRFDLVERRMGITAIVEDNIRPNLSEEVEEELFYIITEALNNSLKHAEATEVKLLFSAAEGQTLVIIEDNGRGFDPDKIKAGLGLENIYQRTDKIGGLVTLDTAVGQGTTVRINI